MKSVGIQEMRFEFGKVKTPLKNGGELMPPYASKTPKGEDPALRFGCESLDLPSMSNEALDAAIYQ